VCCNTFVLQCAQHAFTFQWLLVTCVSTGFLKPAGGSRNRTFYELERNSTGPPNSLPPLVILRGAPGSGRTHMLAHFSTHSARCSAQVQCVAVCCSVLQCVAVCCSVLQCRRGAVRRYVRSHTATNCTAAHCNTHALSTPTDTRLCCNTFVLQYICVAIHLCCNTFVLQYICVAIHLCCTVLQSSAVQCAGEYTCTLHRGKFVRKCANICILPMYICVLPMYICVLPM